jgi:hypothetical protein
MTTCANTLTQKNQLRACKIKKSQIAEIATADRDLYYDINYKQYAVIAGGDNILGQAFLGKNLARARVLAPTVALRAGAVYWK